MSIGEAFTKLIFFLNFTGELFFNVNNNNENNHNNNSNNKNNNNNKDFINVSGMSSRWNIPLLTGNNLIIYHKGNV